MFFDQAFANLIYSGRLNQDNTDVEPHIADNITYLALLNNDCAYKKYRYSVSWWKPYAPTDRSIALL